MSAIRRGASAGSHLTGDRIPSGIFSGVRPVRLRATWAVLVAAAVPVCSGCGTARLSQSDVENRIGRATERDIVALVPEILQRHGYVIYNNRRTADMLYFETNWRSRAPFEDEAAQGADDARTRIIIRARKSSGMFFTLRLEAQNQVSGIPYASSDLVGSRWSTIPATDLYKEYVSELSSEIRMQVDSGQRRRR